MKVPKSLHRVRVEKLLIISVVYFSFLNSDTKSHAEAEVLFTRKTGRTRVMTSLAVEVTLTTCSQILPDVDLVNGFVNLVKLCHRVKLPDISYPSA